MLTSQQVLNSLKTTIEAMADTGISIDSEAIAEAIAEALGEALGSAGRPLWIKSVTASLADGSAFVQCGEDTRGATRIRLRFTGLSSPDAVLAVGYGTDMPGTANAVAILRPFDEFADDVPAGTDISCLMFEEDVDGTYLDVEGGINDAVQVSYYA